jgi:hypothetical protein
LLRGRDTSASTCSELGWTNAAIRGDDQVCGNSVMNGTCSGLVALADAAAFCESGGARLCTASELSNDEARASGCNDNRRQAWSSTPCSTSSSSGNAAYVAAGATSLFEGNATCADAADSSVVFYTKCCADVVALGGTARPSLAPAPAQPTQQPTDGNAAAAPENDNGDAADGGATTGADDGASSTSTLTSDGSSSSSSSEPSPLVIASASVAGLVAAGLLVGGGLAYRARAQRGATGKAPTPPADRDVEMAGI